VAGVIKWTLIIVQGVPLQNLGGQKASKIWRDFLATFDFDREYIWNGSTNRKSEKRLINYISSTTRRYKFGELWSTNKKVLTHPSGLFSDTKFRPLGVQAPQIFIRARESSRFASAHPKLGRGSP